jgi:hypothetical protein
VDHAAATNMIAVIGFYCYLAICILIAVVGISWNLYELLKELYGPVDRYGPDDLPDNLPTMRTLRSRRRARKIATCFATPPPRVLPS